MKIIRSVLEKCSASCALRFAQLSPAQREFFLWHDLGDLSVEELAASSGKSRHAVEMILFRARRRLREILLAEGLTEAELCDYLVHIPPNRLQTWHARSNRQDEE